MNPRSTLWQCISASILSLVAMAIIAISATPAWAADRGLSSPDSTHIWEGEGLPDDQARQPSQVPA